MHDADYTEGQRLEDSALRAENQELRRALDWVSSRYAQTLAGRSVRDADECLERARLLLAGEGGPSDA